MAALDFTLNQMTMLALTLMVGIVIDDAIVVLENIYRFVEEKGMTPMQAAIEGTKEIGLAVMATTLSLLAVFLPVGFLGGIVGRFMSSFGLTSAAAIAISLIVSFTLTPMLAARWIKHDHDANARATSRGAASTGTSTAPTRGCSQFSMAHRWVDRRRSALWSSASLVPLFRMSGINFTPDEDESRFQISVRLPVGSSLAATQSLMDRIARDMREQLPGVSDTLAIPGGGGGGFGQTNAGSLFVRLKPIDEREFSQQELIVRARRLIQPYRQSAVISIQSAGRHRRAERPRRRDPVRAGRAGPAEARSVHRAGARRSSARTTLLVDVDRTVPAGAARAAAEHRPQARRRSRRPGAGRLADGQRAGGGAEGHDVQRRVGPVRRACCGRRTPSAARPSRSPRRPCAPAPASWCSCATW